MVQVLKSIQPVLKQSKFVQIDNNAIEKFTKTVKKDELYLMELSQGKWFGSKSFEDQIAFMFVFQSLNFCFWGEPKWEMVDKGKTLGGSFSLIYVLKKAIAGGLNILDSDVLSKLSLNETKNIFKAKVEIPLLIERHQMLVILGKSVSKLYDGMFSGIIDKSEYKADRIVEVLANDFPTIFADTAIYKGKKVLFYKRAQLLPHYLSKIYKLGLIDTPITNLDKLTAFADYKAPQMLRKYGILIYEKSLANKVDNKVEITSGSDEEIEIRANMIWACELIAQKLKSKYPEILPTTVNDILWIKSQDKSQQDKPYHRTRTVWY